MHNRTPLIRWAAVGITIGLPIWLAPSADATASPLPDPTPLTLPVVSVPVTIDGITGSTTCKLTQAVEGTVGLSGTDASEHAITTSTDDCTSGEKPSVTSDSTVTNLGLLSTTNGAKTTTRSGQGPAIANAVNDVPIAEYGPKIEFRFLSKLSIAGGGQARICRDIITNVELTAESESSC